MVCCSLIQRQDQILNTKSSFHTFFLIIENWLENECLHNKKYENHKQQEKMLNLKNTHLATSSFTCTCTCRTKNFKLKMDKKRHQLLVNTRNQTIPPHAIPKN